MIPIQIKIFDLFIESKIPNYNTNQLFYFKINEFNYEYLGLLTESNYKNYTNNLYLCKMYEFKNLKTARSAVYIT